MKQRTLAESCSFSGKGLHTGRVARMTVLPAPENTGVRFLRTDIGPDAFIDAHKADVRQVHVLGGAVVMPDAFFTSVQERLNSGE